MKNKIWIILSLFLLASCLGGYSSESRFYSLQAQTDEAEVSSKKLSVGIGDVRLPESVDRPQIVSSQENSPEIEISETNRWSEPLDTMIQRVLSADISACLPKAAVKEKNLGEKFGVVVSVEIVRFDRIVNQKAVLEAWWALEDNYGNAIYREKFSGEEKTGDSFDDFVRAESALLGQMSRKISEKIALVRNKGREKGQF